MKNSKLLPFIVIISMFFIGYFFGHNKKFTPSYYFANTVGTQLIEQNALYTRLGTYSADAKKEQYAYNRDMILIIDCSWWIKEIKYDSRGLNLFIEGLKTSFQIVKASDMLLCDGDIKKFIRE